MQWLRISVWLASLGAIAPSAIAGQQVSPQAAARRFVDTCASCHVVGGGESAGGDLAEVAKQPRREVRTSVARMQDYGIELTAAQIDAFTDLLRSRDVKAHLASAARRDETEKAPSMHGAAESGSDPMLGECSTRRPDREGAPEAPSPVKSERASEASSDVHTVRGDVLAPVRIYHVEAAYPEELSREGVEGDVVLEAVIGVDGAVDDICVISGNSRLRPAAVASLRQWKFRPATLHGVAVAVYYRTTVNFRSRR